MTKGSVLKSHPSLFFRLSIFCFSILALTSCDPRINPIESRERLPLPTKDEIALINGEPFTLQRFLRLRELLKDKSPEVSYWVGVGALVVYQKSQERERALEPYQATDIALYAVRYGQRDVATEALELFFGTSEVSPEQVKDALDRLVSQAHVQKNPVDLAAF